MQSVIRLGRDVTMSIPRLTLVTDISDHLNLLAAMVKSRSRAGLTDANRILEIIAARFFNALFDWNLVNLNSTSGNHPAADLGDRQLRIAIQVTNEERSTKIKHTMCKAIEHGLGKNFDRVIIFFLLSRKPNFPTNFVQPPNGPMIETWDIPTLLEKMQNTRSITTLSQAASVLDEEMGHIGAPRLEQIVNDMVNNVSAHASQLASLKVDLLSAVQRIQEAERRGFALANDFTSDVRSKHDVARLSKFLDEQLASIDLSSVELLKERGAVALAADDYEKAENCFRRILDVVSGDLDSAQNLLLVLVKRNRIAEAVALLDKMRSMEGMSEKHALATEGWMWSYLGEWSRCERVAVKQLEMQEAEGYTRENVITGALTLLTLGNLKHRQNDVPGAKAAMRRAAELHRKFGLNDFAENIDQMVEKLST